MNLIKSLLLAGLATAVHTAYAADAAVPAQATSAAAPKTLASSTSGGAGKTVCTTESVTGSRFPRRICYTQADWQKIKEAGMETTRELQGQPTGPVEKGG